MADCVWCGSLAADYTTGTGRHCQPCWVLVPKTIVQLGLSIRRFMRRAEVEGLVEVVERRMEHSPACDYVMYGDVACDCDIGRASDALSRLAALAMEVGS